MYDPTNLPDELNRKTLSAIQYLLDKNRTGELSDNDLKTGVISIWNVVSGLVSGQMAELLDSIINSTADIKGEEKVAIFLNEKNNFFYVVRWVVGSNKVELSVHSQVSNYTIKECESSMEAKNAFDLFIKKLEKLHRRI